jgi:hypothetical protein
LTTAPQRAKLKSLTGITTDCTEDIMPSLTDLFVADWKKHGTMAILDGMISHNLYDKEFIDNLLESRMVIECTCAGLT